MIQSKYLAILASLVLFFFIAGCDENKNPVEPHETHNEAEGLVLKINDANFVVVKEGKVQQGKIQVQLNQTTEPITVRFLDEDGDEFTPTEAGSALSLTLQDNTIATVAILADNPWGFTVSGKKAGTTGLDIKLMHGDHPDFTAPTITVEVTP